MPLLDAKSPAKSVSNAKITLSQYRESRTTCLSVKAVPLEATTFSMPDCCAEITSNSPSTKTAWFLSLIADLATSKPKSTDPLLKIGVSGEFIYLASFDSPIRDKNQAIN